jgi:hypothetical protein
LFSQLDAGSTRYAQFSFISLGSKAISTRFAYLPKRRKADSTNIKFPEFNPIEPRNSFAEVRGAEDLELMGIEAIATLRK